MNFKIEMNQRVTAIEAVLEQYKPNEEGFAKTLYQAMNYSLLSGGKRIRPMLINESYRVFGQANQVIIEPFMAAIEMIHTYSLIHDDLPALDNDDYRRGRKTNHVVFGEAMAILAGDGLLNEAFETATKAFDLAKDHEQFKNVARALQVLAKKAGARGMIAGQVVDIETVGQPNSKESLMYIYTNKTAALIEGSLTIGAILAGASDEDIDKMERIGNYVGIAFQIQDDILDVTSSFEVLGKPINSDDKNDKVTYVTLYGIEKSKEAVAELSNEALKLLKEIDDKGNNLYLEELIKYLIMREK